ncbi:hypothetical protein N8152_01035, partial [bacterium]|nr:hypothetical protein [bacterium]
MFPRSNATVVLDTWTHVAVTVDSVNQEVAFYDDGKPAGGGSSENAAAGDGGGGPLVFGTNFECVNSSALVSNSTVCAAFTGHIDNVRLWSKPLKAWEVRFYKDRHLHVADPTVEFLVSNYSFDATFADTHARAHDLLGFDEFPFDMTNSISLNDTFFAVAEPAALRFAANTTATVPLTDVTEFAPESLTFEAWIKPDKDSAHFGGFIASLGHAGWRVAMMCNANATSALDKVGCCIDGAHVEQSIGFFGNDDDPCTAAASSTTAIEKGDWTHVAVVVTQPGGGFKNAPRSVEYSVCFVINGESAGCSMKSTHGVSSGLPADANVTALRESDALGVLSGHFQLGGYKGKSGSCGNDDACSLMAFRGLMDNVRVWSAPLDHATVASYKQAEIDHDHPYLQTLIANYSLSVGKFHGSINEGAISDSRAGVWDVYDGTVVNGAYDRNEDVTLASQPVIVPAPEGASAFYFNGFDQYVETPYNASLAPSDVLTIEVWIKPVGPDFVMQPIVGLGDLGWSVHLMCAGGEFANEVDWRGCCGNHVNGALGFLSSLDQLTGEECAAVPSSTVGVTYGRWNLVAVTVDVTRRTAEFFIDGKFVNEVASWDVTLTDGGAKPLLLGGCPRDPHEGCQALFMGYMDDLRVWHAVVDEAHVNGFSNRTLTGAAHPNADDLLLYYRFDASAGSGNGTVWDLGPYELHGVAMSADTDDEVYFNSSIGTLPGAPAPPPAPPLPPPFLQGPESSSLYFNGADTHVTFDDSNTLAAMSDVTFEAWIKPAGEVRAETIVMYGNYGWGVLLMCNPEDGAKRGCCGTHKSGALGFWTATSRMDNTACASTPSSTEAVTRGQWNHVAVAARRGLVEFYINGAFAGAVAGEHVRVKGGTGSSQLVLGGLGASCPTCLPYGGYMDEIRLFGGMLPGHEIAAWKDFAMSPKHPSSKALLAHFTFDATSGTAMNRAAPAIGFAVEGDHVPMVVEDIEGFGANFGGEIAMDGDTLVITQNYVSQSVGNKLFIYRREAPGVATSRWLLVQTIDGNDPELRCGLGYTAQITFWGPVQYWNLEPGGKGLAVHGDVIATTCQRTDQPSANGGFAAIFTRDTPGDLNSNWTLSHRVTGDDMGILDIGTQSEAGLDKNKNIRSVAVHGDTVILGKTDETNRVLNRHHFTGCAYVFARDTQNTNASAPRWKQVQRLLASDYTDHLYQNGRLGYFGLSVAIDGDQMVVGAMNGEVDGYLVNANGAAYVFARDTPGDAFSNWTETARITPDPDVDTYKRGYATERKNSAGVWTPARIDAFPKLFGWDLDLRDDLLFVAAPGTSKFAGVEPISPDGGAVFVYKRLDANLSSAWERETEIYPVDPTPTIDVDSSSLYGRTSGLEFAHRVSYRDGVLAVGLYRGQGKMEVYTRTTSFDGGFEWSHIPHDFHTKTNTNTRGPVSNCGYSVITDGAIVIMGCRDHGTVSIFSLSPAFGPGVVSSSSHEYALWNSGEHVTLVEASSSSATETTTSPRAGPTSMYFNGADTKVTTRCGSNDAHAWNCGGATSATGYSGLRPDDYLTFTAWIKPDDVVTGQMIAMLGEWGWGVLLMCPGGAGKGCCGNHVTNAIGFWSDNNVTTSSCAETLSSDVGVTRGQWNHIAVVVDASHYTNEVIFYVNGAIAGRRRSNTRGEIVSPLGGLDHASFVVGRGPCPNGCLDYKGHIDELSVYTALWSASEIGNWYDKPATAGNASTRASPHFARGILGYSFDDARGDDVLNVFPDPDDASFGGNRFDGQITSRDAGYVVWDVSNRATLSPAIGFPSPPPPAAPPPPFNGQGPSSLRFNGGNTSAFLKESSEGGRYLDFTDSGLMTFEAWIKPERFGKFQFLAAAEGFEGDREGWSVAIMCPEGAGDGCCGDHVDGSLGFMARKAVSSDCTNARSTKTSLALGMWQHVAVSVDATQTTENTGPGLVRRRVSFYVNGTLVGVSTSSSENAFAPIQLPSPTHGPDVSGVRVGAGLCGQSEDFSLANGETRACGHFGGWMDEMKLWRAALSDVTVKTHYDKEIVPWHVNLEKLVVYYKFNAGSGTTVAPYDTRVNTTHCTGGSVVDSTNCAFFHMHDLSLHPASLESEIWATDVNARDAHVNAAPGLSVPSPPPSPPPTLPPHGGPSSLYFNGRDTHAMAPYVDSLLPSTGLTFQAWIKPAELHRSQVVAMLGANGWALMLTCNEGAGSGCCGSHLSHAPGTLMFWNVEQALTGDECRDAPTSTKRVVKDKWQHVAVVADEATDTVRFFIDGEPAGVRSNARGARDQLVNDGLGISRVDQLRGSDDPIYFGGVNSESEQQMRTVALQGDVAVIGAPEVKDSSARPQRGSVYVFERDSTGWHETQILVPDVQLVSQGMNFGWSVDVNAAGDVIVVGGNVNDANCGAGPDWVDCPAYVFTRDTSATPFTSWTLAQKLSPHYEILGMNAFGQSVAIDKHDDTIVISAYKMKVGSYTSAGGAFVFARDVPGSFASNWTQVGCPTDCEKGMLIAPEPGVSLTDFKFGQSLDIDNGTIAVNALVKHSAHLTHDLSTTVYMFMRNVTGDMQSAWSLAARITAPENVGNPAWTPYFA